VFALVKCTSTADVQQAVRIASDHGASISTLGGGHDWAGRAAGRGGITLDLRQLNAVELNRDRSAVTIGGGTLIDDVLAGIPDDLAIVTGTISHGRCDRPHGRRRLRQAEQPFRARA
jgi:UDP-N-acetylenolpyruvoylglucosamine reductase